MNDRLGYEGSSGSREKVVPFWIDFKGRDDRTGQCTGGQQFKKGKKKEALRTEGAKVLAQATGRIRWDDRGGSRFEERISNMALDKLLGSACLI